MKRERATQLLNDAITRLEHGDWPLTLIEELYVFGSYARGAPEPNDVDIVVQHTTDRTWLDQSLDAFINGRDAYTQMKQGLRGRTRGISFQFQGRASLTDEGFELTLLWKRGEPFDLARRRLTDIKADPHARSAPRDHMLPVFETLAQTPPRPVRIELHELHHAGKISITRLDLLDAEPSHATTARHIRERWIPTSPLRRAGASAVAHLENNGVSPERIELHGQHPHAHDLPVDHFIDLGWRYFGMLSRYLDDGQSWLEVPHPHRTKPLEALLIQPQPATPTPTTRNTPHQTSPTASKPEPRRHHLRRPPPNP